MKKFLCACLLLAAVSPLTAAEPASRPRVIVSSDIGGTDPDDYQSMAHLFLYTDALDLEGVISSPYGPGRKHHILAAIAAYEQDYPNLRTYSDRYPTAGHLHAITKQGAFEAFGDAGFGDPTEGSEWIIKCARRDDPRPLWVLVWGGIDDVAQALHDAPDILPKLRVYYIGGPNKKWGANAYNYLERHHPNLWIIEANSTYTGFFEGGNQSGEWGNTEFVSRHVAAQGALGKYLAQWRRGEMKMGDTPSVYYVLGKTPEDPTQPNWGGSFVRAWERPRAVFPRLTTAADRVEQYAIVDLELPPGHGVNVSHRAHLAIENQLLPGFVDEAGVLRFRFSPKAAKTWSYIIHSDMPAVDGRKGELTSFLTPPDAAQRPAARTPNWWTDNPAPELQQGSQQGAKTINRWREEFLRDFAARMIRCATPDANPPKKEESAGGKPRLLVLTDIGGDPDDQMSMVRLMTYANHVEFEGLIATHVAGRVNPGQIEKIVTAYGQVRNNLELHEPGFPNAEALLKQIASGLPLDHMAAVGDGKDSTGSDLLIRAVDRDDPRPLWVTVWGGPNVLAQALWKVRATRSPEALAKFVAKLRVHAISDQDDSGPWIRKNFPGLFYIVTPGINAGGGFHHATWIGIGGDRFHGRFGGADFSLVSNEWLDRNIRRKGPLGAVYPHWEFMMEGDTPSFLNLINNGLSDPEHPDWGGWGGRYELYTPRTEKWFIEPETRPIWTNVQDEVLGNDGQWHTTNHATIWRWRAAYQNDFAARMDWTTKPYAQANHPPIVKLDHPVRLEAKPGQRVELSATSSSDPDGDPLSFEWFCYEEPGTRRMSNSSTGVKHDVVGFDQPKASLTVKTSRVVAPGAGTMHIILAVTDHGTPRLTRYQRVIINVVP